MTNKQTDMLMQATEAAGVPAYEEDHLPRRCQQSCFFSFPNLPPHKRARLQLPQTRIHTQQTQTQTNTTTQIQTQIQTERDSGTWITETNTLDVSSAVLSKLQQPWTHSEDCMLRDLVQQTHSISTAAAASAAAASSSASSATTFPSSATSLVTPTAASLSAVNWVDVASKLGPIKRSPTEVFAHYMNVSGQFINKGPWSAEEEKKLLGLVRKYEEHEWSKVAEELGSNRTPFSCLKHYQQTLNGRLVNAEEWNGIEDACLRRAVHKIGTENWQLVADVVPFRTADQCLNRWHKLSQRSTAIGDWSSDGERMLYLAVVAHEIPGIKIQHGDHGVEVQAEKRSNRGHKWQSVCKFIEGKNDVQCREKWTNNLDPTIDDSPLTSSEDALLCDLVRELGSNCWSQVALRLPGRTDAMVRNRWLRLQSAANANSKSLKVLPQKHQRNEKAAISNNEFSSKKVVDWK